MKAQTRRGALLESAVNLLVGFSISYAINDLVLPLYGMQPTTGALFGLGGIFTIASVIRSFFLRRVFEWMRIRKAPPAFLYIAEELAAERTRQISGEGYSLAHDDRHACAELAMAAAAYCLAGASSIHACAATEPKAQPLPGTMVDTIRRTWPWDLRGFKPQDERRSLVKAGAMIIAEIGRRDRRALRGHP
jgi:hypothetical protein